MRILVVEDDPMIAQLIETILEPQQYVIDVANDGQMGLDMIDAYEYDAILLDVTLPKKDGISICRQIRAGGNTVPILLLTGLNSPADRARGLNAGADDYLGKPFDPDELLARLRAILRRSHQLSTPILKWGNLQLDPANTTVTYGDKLVAVTPKEYALLELFLRNSKRVFSCNAILDHLWSYGVTPSEEAIRTHIKGLRQKLKLAGAASDAIETVYGMGYRLKPVNAPDVNLLKDTWAKFKDQVVEQVAVLEQLAVSFLNQDIQSDWQEIGRNIAHSLSGSLGMFGFSLSSELARQIEKLLSGSKDLTVEQGEWLFSMVAALQEELDRPVSPPDLYCFDPDPAISILVVSGDGELDRGSKGDALLQSAIQSIAIDLQWDIEIVPTIAAAKSQLRQSPARCILLAARVAEQPEEVIGLLVEVGKHVPAIPVILLAAAPGLHPEIHRFGTCLSICPTSPTDIILAIERSIDRVASTQTHILIVDDDLKILAVLRALLVPWGFRITTLSEPENFWKIMSVTKPDLLILDVEMPTISGLALCQSVRDRSDWDHLPIIFLTARTEPNLIQQVFAIGADDFVTKPVVGPEMIARINNLMERQQMQQLKAVDRLQLSDRAQVQAALISIDQSIRSDREFPVEKSQQILNQLDLLHQLLNNN
jgi:DNA-binding response OmpR family regulator/HPt (histidine-containing phosphotransfer) domain-containing protein